MSSIFAAPFYSLAFLKSGARTKKFFHKNFFVPSFGTFYCGSFEPSYVYVHLSISAGSWRWILPPKPWAGNGAATIGLEGNHLQLAGLFHPLDDEAKNLMMNAVTKALGRQRGSGDWASGESPAACRAILPTFWSKNLGLPFGASQFSELEEAFRS